MEPPFDKIDGVHSTLSGYIGGHKKNPTYRQVSSGNTGHTEAVEIVYDPGKVTYKELLKVFWRNIDPTAKNSQFCDHGEQFRSGIFFLDKAQKKAAELSKKTALEDLRQRLPVETKFHTEITKASRFYPAEDYHQDYYTKNPIRYKYYRRGCGRDKRLQELWGAGEPKPKKRRWWHFF